MEQQLDNSADTNALAVRYEAVDWKKRTRSKYDPVPLRYQQVVALHLAGKKCEEIKQITGYSTAMVYRILSRDDVQHYRQQLLATTQQEFEALFSKVVDTIRQSLDSSDENVRLAATQQWLKYHGKRFEAKSSEVTAEDVVAHILHADNVNIQVNRS